MKGELHLVAVVPGTGCGMMGRKGKSCSPPSRTRLSRTADSLAATGRGVHVLPGAPAAALREVNTPGWHTSGEGFSTEMTSPSTCRRCTDGRARARFRRGPPEANTQARRSGLRPRPIGQTVEGHTQLIAGARSGSSGCAVESVANDWLT